MTTDITPEAIAALPGRVTELIEFLNGAGPLHGKDFGEKDECGRAFWWRHDLGDITAVCELVPAQHDALTAAQARIAELEGAIADAVGALDAAGEDLSEFANVLSRDPREANLAYQSARDVQDVLARGNRKGATP
jgi:hypothetical protein